jgi:hypothetical protein
MFSAPELTNGGLRMNVSGASAGYFVAQARTMQASQQSVSAATEPFPAEGTSSGASPSGAGLLSNMHILSSVQTTLPNGKVLGIARFDLSGGGLGTSQSAPTDADKRDDAQMLSALKQMANYLNYNPTAADIKLEGTAAIDLSA